jgi:thiol-disulfide isomerase/thioredoxin
MAVALATASLLVGACSAGGGPGDDAPHVAADNALEADLLPTNAVELPEFDLARFERLLGELRGTPVLVNVWGSWCQPCREEAGHLAAAHREFGDRVQFLGIDILDARESARAFMEEFDWTYPSVYDPPGAIRDSLGLLGQPVTLFYAANGELAGRWVGPIPPDELRRRLADLLRR